MPARFVNPRQVLPVERGPARVPRQVRAQVFGVSAMLARGRSCCLAALCGALWLGQAGDACALESEVHSELNVQLYDVMSPYEQPVVRRRRYTHTLGLDVSDIDGDTGYAAPELVFRSRLRLDADLGQTLGERAATDLDRYVPGLEQAPFDLMYAFVEGRHYLDGVLGFRLGRQYQIDTLGWWSFDGASLRLDAPGVFGIELYGGFEQRAGLPLLDTSRYEKDGVLRGRRGSLEQNEWPVFLEQKRLAPAYGASIMSLGQSWVQARLSYRKVINRDRVVTSPFPDSQGDFTYVDDDRTSSEQAGASLVVPWGQRGAVDGDLVYDLYLRKFSQATLSLDWFAFEDGTLGAGYEYYLPTFDGDSIFNWFSLGANESVELRASAVVLPRVDVSLTGGIRMFRVTGDVDALDAGAQPALDQFLFGNARYRLPQAQVRLDTEAEWGDTGHRVGGNLSAEHRYYEGYYDSLVILSLYDFSDALRPERDALSGGYVIGGGVAPKVSDSVRSRLGIEWEHMVNRLSGHRFRVLLTFNLTVLP